MCITNVDDSYAGGDVTGLFEVEEVEEDGSVEFPEEGNDVGNDDCVDGSEVTDEELDESVADEVGLELPLVLTAVLSEVSLPGILVS